VRSMKSTHHTLLLQSAYIALLLAILVLSCGAQRQGFFNSNNKNELFYHEVLPNGHTTTVTINDTLSAMFMIDLKNHIIEVFPSDELSVEFQPIGSVCCFQHFAHL